MPSSALAAALCVVAALLAAGRPCTSQSLPAASSLDGTTLSGLAAIPASEDLQQPVGTFTPTPSAESSEAEPAVPASEDEFALLQALPLPPTFAPASEAPQLPVGLVAAAPQPEMFSQADNTLAAKQQLPGFEEGLPADALVALGTVSQPAQAGSEPLSAPPERSNFTQLISLLDPPPDFTLPPLSAQQQANLPRLQQLRQGLGTVGVRRNVGNFDGADMACGMGYLSNYFAAFFAGLPDALFQNGRLCGTCVRVWCVDSICLDPLVRNATFMVTDRCTDCKGDDLLVSARGFANLTGIDINISPTLRIAWALESCGIKMLASNNNNPTFLAFNFSNLKQLLRAVAIGNLMFQGTNYGSWELNSPGVDIQLAPPYLLTLQSDVFGDAANGEPVTFGLLPEAAEANSSYVRLRYKARAISAYSPEPVPTSGVQRLGCGFGWLDPSFSGAYIGVGSSAFSGGTACGRCVEVQCDDQACSDPGSSLVVQIVDLCGDCFGADISLSMPAFLNFTGAAPASNPTLEVSWEFVDCSDLIDGTIKMLVKRGGNAYYQSFNFANARVPIAAVAVNGDRLRRSTSNWWDWNPGAPIDPRGPFEIALLSSNREVLRIKVTRLQSQDVGVQFKSAAD
ncbi:hypothetical protein D9Q98_002751 [Chlorella vulgaris]|uniref:Expansin-like EG45 domain-containing protein n=1 Tax=Chlorella vulgaris TaxID=3077 RepID=A0A9D4TTU8_CHLVU|nr:hypothetical protein D9Q98_002751 [Chlorella vulgaris]